jgi:predicted transcriptional regulator
MLLNYSYHIWFKVCRSIKRKYKLSTNCLLVLNGSYIYSKSINSDFTRRKLLDFVSYYNHHKLGEYITVLMSHGFIMESYKSKTIQYYTISPIGLEVIEELNKSYEIELLKFCNQYNISL